MYELALFAGAGGGILGGKLLGWTTVCAVELDEYARRVLLARQDDGCLEPFPIWDDVCTFDGRPWRGVVDIVTGGFPCQDISSAGKGAGIDGARSGLWGEMARIIREVGPRFVLVENSPMLTSRGLGRVVGDLAAMGYDARWGVLGAVDAGAPHKRARIWIVAYATGIRWSEVRERLPLQGGESESAKDVPDESGKNVADDPQHGRKTGRARRLNPSGARQREQSLQTLADAEGVGGGAGLCENGSECNGHQSANGCGNMADSSRILQRREEQRAERKRTGARGESEDAADSDNDGSRSEEGDAAEPRGDGTNDGISERDGGWWVTEPDVGRVAHGVAARVDRLRCLGNGQVSAVVRLAWRLLAPKE